MVGSHHRRGRFATREEETREATERRLPAGDGHERVAALEYNQRLFRYANERTLALGGSHRIAFLCECGRRDCFQSIYVTASEYQGVVAEDAFVVLRGHESPQWHEVVTDGEDYAVVRVPLEDEPPMREGDR